MSEKIAVIGSGHTGSLVIASLKDKLGDDIQVITSPKEEIFKIKAPIELYEIDTPLKSGRERRRERRKKERQSKKNKT